jgi:phosphomannomutase
MGIFKAYDVRGKFPTEIDDAFARRLGRAFAGFLGGKGTVGVGHDHRTSSPGLARAFCDGVHDGGVSTVELGLVTTPTLYFVVGSRQLTGGCMVTASHNPADDNGFKLCREQVKPVGSVSGLKEIELACSRPAAPAVQQRGKRMPETVTAAYVEHVTKLAGPIGKLKVAFDCGNGVVGPTLDALLARWPSITPVKLFFPPDGTFPNHPANPLVPANLDDLRAAVTKERCDLGVAFDGDGDRCVFIDDAGEPVSPDLLTALLVRPVLERFKGATIVHDLTSSRVVKEEIERHGGVAVEERVGHAFMKATMRAKDAPFAGESSGHYYWRDHWFADSALITVGHVLALVGKEKKTLRQLVTPLRRTARSSERNFHVEDKDAALERLVAKFPDAAVTRLDGVTLRTKTWWFNARKSNTEPLVRVNAEADDQAVLARCLAEVQSVLGIPVAH